MMPKRTRRPSPLDYEPAPGFEYDHLEEQWDSEDSTEFRNLSPRTYSRHVRMGIAPGFEDVEVWVDSEDLSEEDSQSSQAGLSRHRASSESAGLRLDGKTPFLWQLVLFFLPDWLPEPVAEQYRVRLSLRDARCTRNYEKADIILTYHGMSKKEEKHAQRMQVGSKRILGTPSWFSRVYFSGICMPLPKEPPLFVNGKGKGLMIAVPDLNDDELRQDVMMKLEINGATVVHETLCDTIIIPNGHRFMRDPPQWMKGLKRISVGTVLKSVASVGEQAPILLQEARTRQKSKVSTMVPSSPVTVSSTRHRHSRTAFTAEDRYHLARWLAYMCPEPAGRLAINLYRRLVAHSPDDPVYWWASRHSADAWKEHYKRNRDTDWKDGTILDRMIEFNVYHGVDKLLMLEHERQPRMRIKSSPLSPRPLNREKSTSDASQVAETPAAGDYPPEKAGSREVDGSSERRAREQDRSEALEVDKELLLD